MHLSVGLWHLSGLGDAWPIGTGHPQGLAKGLLHITCIMVCAFERMSVLRSVLAAEQARPGLRHRLVTTEMVFPSWEAELVPPALF